MYVTNNHRSQLGLHTGQVLPPGEAVKIRDWERVKDNAVFNGWVKARILTLSEDAPELEIDHPNTDADTDANAAQDDQGEQQQESESAAENAPELDEKDQLIAALKEKGIDRDRRTSVEKLRQQLQDVESEAA